MKFFALILLALSGNALICGQSIEILDRNKIVKNKISRVSLFEYEYKNGKPETKGIKARVDSFDTNGYKVSQVNFRESGTVQLTVTSKYDLAGNRTDYAKSGHKYNFVQHTKFDAKGIKLQEWGFNGIDSFKNVFNYNKIGKLAEVNYFIKRKLDEKRTFTYVGNSATIKVQDGNGQVKYLLKFNYSATNKITEETQTENDNNVSRKISYTYDKNDNLVSETKYLNGKFANKTTYVYTSGNLVSEIYTENSDNIKTLTNKYLYNDNNAIREENLKADGSKEFTKNTYSYDVNGVCKTIDSYYGAYKRQVLSVFVYNAY